MRNPRSRLLMVLLASCGLAGCGTVVPNIKEAWDSDIPGAPADPATDTRATPPISGAAQIEFEIKKQIFCDLKDAVREANRYYVEKNGTTNSYLPKDWAAQVSLSLQVDESAALNPGVAFNTPMASATSTFGVLNKTPITTSTPQLFSLGVGGTLSSTATRTDKFDPYWTIAELSKPTPEKAPDGTTPLCRREKPDSDPFVEQRLTPAKSSPLITEDVDGLGITTWLIGALFANDFIPSVTGPRPLKAKEVAAERRVLEEKRFGFNQSARAQIVASGQFTSFIVELVDNDPELQNLYLDLDLNPKPNPELKKQNPELYRKKLDLYNRKRDLYNKKLEEKVKPALENELDKLLKPGKVTPAQIAQFFGSGGSPSELHGLVNGGYDQPEIADIITAKRQAAASGGGGGTGGGGTNPKPDTLTIEIKFVIVSSGNVLPTWKLVRVSSGTSSTPLFAIGRTRTHDVIITIGPPGQQTSNTHLASQIGVSVANALQSSPPSNTFTFPF